MLSFVAGRGMPVTGVIRKWISLFSMLHFHFSLRYMPFPFTRSGTMEKAGTIIAFSPLVHGGET